MTPKINASYGTWKSPITAQLLSAKGISIMEVDVHGSTGSIYFLEGRPAEGGRCCIVEFAEGGYRDVLPKTYNARTGVHEYGGAAFTVTLHGNIIFADWDTKGVFSLNPTSGEVNPVVHSSPSIYYADFNVNPADSQWILAVQENHTSTDVENSLVAIDASTRTTEVIASGADFYAHPQFNPDGDMVCWTQWDHPDMPWTGTVLYIASWRERKLGVARAVAGKAGTESISQPRWSPNGDLLFSSDRTGFWQLYRINKGQSEVEAIRLKGLEDFEFAGPEWLLGSCTYTGMTTRSLIASCTGNATSRLIVVDLDSETWSDPQFPIVDIRNNAIRRVSDTTFVVIGSTLTSPTALYLLDITNPSQIHQLKTSADTSISTSFFSIAQHISFPRAHGPDKDGEAHALFLPPTNPDYEPQPHTLPPLILSLHGGPTTDVAPGLSLSCQYYTSRGYAFASVNYAGSSGYGRAYRDRLNGKWGISDVADAASCVAFLANTGRVDSGRVGVVGGSAGGYATLQALCVYPDIWAGGVSLYGISNLKMLAQHTHKFESRYLDGLLFEVGDGVAEKERVFQERSPLFHADRIKAPLLLLQGAEDRVVPREQADEMERTVREMGRRVRLVVMEGEGHGFRREENVEKAILEQERWWVETLLRS
ncbi:hypothetical protein MMC18_006499 [Xylographa bjoerkii]|nr:hypothetical protein [Xylographa bjoerkii]